MRAGEAGGETVAYGYTDESQYNVGRYRGVALVSALSTAATQLTVEARDVLMSSGATECKWEKVRTARMRFLAEKLLNWALDAALMGRLLVDVLTWDVGDSAHAGAGIPYLKRLHQMYHDLLADALAHRWPQAGRWTLYPDEQNALRWSMIQVGLPCPVTVVPGESHREPLIQVADLFAGLAVFSRAGYDVYEQWLCLSPGERRASLSGPIPHAHSRLSAADRQRCIVLDDFFTRCKRRLPGISLRTNRGLRTYDSSKPIAFHWERERP